MSYHDDDYDDDDLDEITEAGKKVAADVKLEFDFQGEQNPRVLGAAFVDLKRRRDDAVKLAEGLDSQFKLAKTIVHDRMRDNDDIGIDSLRLPGIGRLSAPKPKWYATIQDLAALDVWAQENRPGIVRRAGYQKLLNELVREYIRDGKQLPPGLGAYPRKSVSVYKA